MESSTFWYPGPYINLNSTCDNMNSKLSIVPQPTKTMKTDMNTNMCSFEKIDTPMANKNVDKSLF